MRSRPALTGPCWTGCSAAGKGDIGRLKVEVMTRMNSAIDPSIQVTPYAAFFPTEATITALRHCGLIVACVDRLQVRDDLNRLAKRYLTPMIDVGIEITPAATTRAPSRRSPAA